MPTCSDRAASKSKPISACRLRHPRGTLYIRPIDRPASSTAPRNRTQTTTMTTRRWSLGHSAGPRGSVELHNGGGGDAGHTHKTAGDATWRARDGTVQLLSGVDVTASRSREASDDVVDVAAAAVLLASVSGTISNAGVAPQRRAGHTQHNRYTQVVELRRRGRLFDMSRWTNDGPADRCLRARAPAMVDGVDEWDEGA